MIEKSFENNKTVGFITLGCKVNQYEIEALAELFEAHGYIKNDSYQPCDIYIINTCTVTAQSDKKSRQQIRRALTCNPEAFILVTGCLAQMSAQTLERIDGVDVICGNAGKTLILREADLLVKSGKKNLTTKIVMPELSTVIFEPMNITHANRTRAYIKIEDGCQSNCTYCIIPQARGKIRSKPKADVLHEIQHLCQNGCNEIVLTGIETASYGQDLKDTCLSDLLCEVDKIPSICRIRLGSLDLSIMKPKFIDKIADLYSLAPHFHLSMQSGSDKILSLMKRKYNIKMATDGIKYLREKIPGIQLTTDIIVGFPNESDEDFNKTADFLRQTRFLSAHVFPYSKRKGTPAAEMAGQVPENIKQQRVATLISLQKEIHKEILQGIAANEGTYEVLFERYDEKTKTAYGHTPSFIEVAAFSPVNLRKTIQKVKITSVDEENDICTGQLI